MFDEAPAETPSATAINYKKYLATLIIVLLLKQACSISFLKRMLLTPGCRCCEDTFNEALCTLSRLGVATRAPTRKIPARWRVTSDGRRRILRPRNKVCPFWNGRATPIEALEELHQYYQDRDPELSEAVFPVPSMPRIPTPRCLHA